MINIKEAIVNKLEALDADVHFLQAPLKPKFPFILYREDDNSASTFTDDKEFSSKIIYVIDIYVKGSTSYLTTEVNRIMTEEGFLRTLCKDIADPTEGVQHKTIRFIQYKII